MSTVGIIIYENGQMEKLKKEQIRNGQSTIDGIRKEEIEDYFSLPFKVVVPAYAINKRMIGSNMRLLVVDADISSYRNHIATLLDGYNLVMGTVVLVKIGEYYEILPMNSKDIESIVRLDEIVNGGA